MTALRKHLLPRYSPVGLYSDRQIDRTRGFRLLVHAELEYFLEEMCETFASRMCAAWRKDGRVRPAITALIATLDENAANNGRLKSPNGTNPLVLAPGATVSSKRVRRALDLYRRAVIGRNNGIKEANLLAMLVRIGFVRADLDSVWLGTTNSFGSLRGETAHTSNRVQQPLDPRAESASITAIMRGLRRIDTRLDQTT